MISVPTLTSNSDLSNSSSTTSELHSTTGEPTSQGQTVTAFAVKTQNINLGHEKVDEMRWQTEGKGTKDSGGESKKLGYTH
ncbi:predicted protein [Sclerotinia sclerotiorum 1980 UF-70]|uniref:Uncharacterized protein n=1 Tax=Sclerotinia sclerotiorum (strain ATCC 18683 / 1980 / Ss-1) TaxID=665079 RepID=A7ES57_SCLS1|nr:predicted protein [Sclerotinia sclerotiorum 1980 UF-70]EDN92299.1 predicted protein [Sclerotinia sclerotiorum 1980 UF-70]